MNEFIKAHKFFVKESPFFMQGTNTVKYFLFYPVAYIRFMYYCFKTNNHD